MYFQYTAKYLYVTMSSTVCSTYNNQRMQELYHRGYYKKQAWTCCANADRHNVGCTPAYAYPSCPMSPGCPSPRERRNKTPVATRHINRVKMPSECYDSDDLENEMSFSSPNSGENDPLNDPYDRGTSGMEITINLFQPNLDQTSAFEPF